MNTVELIRAVGPALFGPERWQSPLSYALRVTTRTVRRWASGDVTPPPDVWARIATLMRERVVELNGLLGEVEQQAGGKR
jgi:hypothetical protein